MFARHRASPNKAIPRPAIPPPQSPGVRCSHSFAIDCEAGNRRSWSDLDATDDPLHGEQEGRFYHGYYRCYCYLPLYVFCESVDAPFHSSSGKRQSRSTFDHRLSRQWPWCPILRDPIPGRHLARPKAVRGGLDIGSLDAPLSQFHRERCGVRVPALLGNVPEIPTICN